MPRSKVTNEELIIAVKNSFSICDVLRKINKRLAGGNHSYYSKKINSLKLDTSHFKKHSNAGKF
jgi:hypothetical protein